MYVYKCEYPKHPISLEEQIEILKKRGLLFEDEHKAIEFLKVISYFRLECYWKTMELDNINHIFKPGSRFEDILNLYSFDKELRCIIFSALQSIEIALRTKIIQIVSPIYDSFWFANESLFKDRDIFFRCLRNIEKEVTRAKEEFLVEHFTKYDNTKFLPVWKTLEISSFGTLSKLYCNLKNNDLKKQIAEEIGLPQHIYLESWIKSLTVLRNYVAHHSRIWNRKYPLKPKLPKKLGNPWINDTSSQETIYAQLCCVAYLMDIIYPDNFFKQKLTELLIKFKIDTVAMGFPDKWHNEPLWEKSTCFSNNKA